MDMNEFKNRSKERDAERMAMAMLLSMLESTSTPEMQPIFTLPKLSFAVTNKISVILDLVSHKNHMCDGAGLASEANILLSRVGEALDAFIEQHTEEEASE